MWKHTQILAEDRKQDKSVIVEHRNDEQVKKAYIVTEIVKHRFYSEESANIYCQNSHNFTWGNYELKTNKRGKLS